MYKTVVEFYDLTDGERKYRVGEEFPRPGFSVSAERIAELSSSANKMGKPVIVSCGTEKKEGKKEAKAEPKSEKELSREDVMSMPFFKVKSVAKKNGIDTEGKGAVDLRNEVVERLGL